MATGFLIYNTSGFLQVSEDYLNLSIATRGSVYHPAGYNDFIDSDGFITTGVRVNFPYAIEAPMILIKGRSDGYIFVDRVDRLGFSLGFASRAGPSAATIEYIVVGKDTSLSTATHGLRVFNGHGTLVFDSGKAFLLGREILSVPLTFANNNGSYYTAPAPAKIATATYSEMPWVFCNPLGPIAMYRYDGNGGCRVIGIGFSCTTTSTTVGAVLLTVNYNNGSMSYRVADGGEAIANIGGDSYTDSNYYNTFTLG